MWIFANEKYRNKNVENFQQKSLDNGKFPLEYKNTYKLVQKSTIRNKRQ